MKLYEINQSIRDILAASDDGEIDDSAWERLNELTDARNAKIEAIACIVKEDWATAAAIRQEERNLSDRRKAIERHAERLENYLATEVDDKFESPKARISFRKSEAVVVDNESFLRMYPKYWTTPEPTLSRQLLKEDIKAGKEIPGAHLEERRNIQIK